MRAGLGNQGTEDGICSDDTFFFYQERTSGRRGGIIIGVEPAIGKCPLADAGHHLFASCESEGAGER